MSKPDAPLPQKRSGHLLDPVLAFLEEKHENRQEAKRALKDFLLKEATVNDQATQEAGKLLCATLKQVVKPVLQGQLAAQAALDRVIRAVNDGELITNPQGLKQEIGALSQLMTLETPLATQPPARTDSPIDDQLAVNLLNALAALGEGEEWIKNEIADLREQFTHTQSVASFWHALGQLCERIAREGQFAVQWLTERQMFLAMVTELANRLHDIAATTGGFDHQLASSIQRITASRTLQDLEKLREALIQEAELLHSNTSDLHRQLRDNQQQLQNTQQRLEVLERDLLLAKAESRTDPLTGVANRRAFDDHLAREVALSRRHHNPLSVIVFDLDHFKRVNDTFGHPIGDKVLRTVAERCGLLVRQSDLVARMGGEEFAILLPETNAAAAVQVAEKIRQEIANLRFKTSTKPFFVTCSFGVNELSEESAEQLLAQADAALYVAKQGGRNRVVLADAPPGGTP